MLSFLAIALSLGIILEAPPAFAKPARPARSLKTETPPSAATQRLMQMFSSDIQQTLNACFNQGKVNLAAGADRDGSVICGDKSRNSPVTFSSYVNTLSDVLAAGGLIGFRTALKSDPTVNPTLIAAVLSSSEGATLIRGTLKKGLATLNVVPRGSTASVNFLVDRVMQRLTPILQDPNNLNNLLGTPKQYTQVVENFCNPPGMSLSQIRVLVPGLKPVQVYSICVQESGLADEINSLRNQ
ncbi:MAG: hypothetical protein VKJ46_04255 [Leptolyngbyaceae bacterium]|nr:hypothetical protein [Leptolyngbyaceae bacterium]